jgi:elongation factor G
VDFKVELFDGSYHDVDSNEMSFKMAGILAFRNVSPNARPVLLEPILEISVWTPDEYQGSVMGDISSRRGQILGTEPDGKLVKVRAHVPEAELDKYATSLHSITHGRGTYRQKFHVYQETPPDIAQKVAEGRKKELEEAKRE